MRGWFALVIGGVVGLAACAIVACADGGGGATARAGEAEEIWSVTVPTRRCGDFFVVDAMINGTGPHSLVLDSGASRTTISRRVAREAGVRGRVDEITFGPVTARNVKALVRDLDHLEQAFNSDFDGIVGHPMFREHTVVYDYPAGEVRVTNARLERGGAGVVRTPDPRHPKIPLRIGDRRVMAVVDTGSGQVLSLEKMDSYAFASGPVPVTVTTRFDRRHVSREGRLREDADAGAFVLERPIVTESDRRNLLGQGALRHFVVWFDQRGELVRFERPEGFGGGPIAFPSQYGHGATLEPSAEGFVVRGVLEGSASALAGVREGDLLVAIGGVGLAELGCGIRERPEDEPRSERWTLERGGERVDVELVMAVVVP